MKRHRQLFDDICSFDNLLLAAIKSRRGKRHRPDVATFHHNLEAELLRLQVELHSHTYRPGMYREFVIHDPKRRVISAAPYRDRIVHHALCNVLEPIFERVFIWYIAQCIEVDVASQGKSRGEAIENLREALHLHFTPPIATETPDITTYFIYNAVMHGNIHVVESFKQLIEES